MIPVDLQINWFPGTSLEDMKAEVIHQALLHFDGNKTYAAMSLDISVRTVRNYCRKHDSLAAFRSERNATQEVKRP